MSKVLIVDDNLQNVYLLQVLLKGNGYEVETASNGQDALDRIKTTIPEIIISDILMPVMDGFSLCRRCKGDKVLSEIPFVFYTATYTDPKDEQFALSLGADLFIIKPAEPEEFLKKIFDCLAKHRDGRLQTRYIEVTPDESFLSDYNKRLFSKLEDKLVQLEEKNKALLIKDFAIASSVSAVALTDLEGRITYVNNALTAMWGESGEEYRGREIEALLFGKKENSPGLTGLHAEGGWMDEVESVRKDGSRLVVQVIAHVVKNEKNIPLCLMFSFVDITERRRMQEKLEKIQKLESLGVFAAGIAHDFNNLLTGIYANIDLVKYTLEDDHAATMYVKNALNAFDTAKELTHQLLTFAKGGSKVNDVRQVNINDILARSCTLTLSGSGIQCEFSPESDLHMVDGNEHQLVQVFCNLILNARQAMNDQGHIAISAVNCEVRAGEAGNLPEGSYIRVTVSDKGPGIPPEIIDRIFNPFFTTKIQGSGLGLAMCFSIIKDHHGYIGVESHEGEGSTFKVFLPAAAFYTQTLKGLEPILSDLRGSGGILVMDDDAMVRDAIRNVLTKSGYYVSTASDGTKAEKLYIEAHTAKTPFDVIITDLTIRGDKGGISVVSELRKVDPDISAILISGYTENEVMKNPAQYGFFASLQKPVRMEELLKKVKNAIKNRRKN